MTERLYYDQTYLREFDAEVETCERREDGVWLLLDRSAFYPTSGGQPFDTGRLRWRGGQARVTDVECDARGVWHKLEGECPEQGTAVHGEIDWARRFDHMQQHGGEHMLAGAIWRLYQGRTIGLHLGAEVSSIDVALPDGRTRFADEEIARLEETVNGWIQQDAPCRCWFPTEEELKTLPLRKAPSVKEHVRVVAFGDFEMCACGGTHPSTSGQVGLVKVVETLPAHGMARVVFVCGMRAVRFAQRIWLAARDAAALLSCGTGELPQAAARLKEQLAQEHAAKEAYRRESALREIAALRSGAERLPGGGRLVAASLPGANRDTLRDAASTLIEEADVYALLCAPDEPGGPLLFTRGAALATDMGALLRASGAKGGGRPDFAQGAGGAECLRRAAETLRKGSTR